MKIMAFSDKAETYLNARAFNQEHVEGIETEKSIQHVQNNNADCIILDDVFVKAVKKSKFFRHTKNILIPVKFGTLLLLLLYGTKYIVRNKLKIVGFQNVVAPGGINIRHLHLRPNFKKTYETERCYFPKDWSNKDFLEWLDNQKIEYIVMRWYDDVISEKGCNDIDLLMTDKDAQAIRMLLAQKLGTKAVDIFDLGGSSIDQIAYFPPHIAETLLKNRIKAQTNEPGYVPAPLDYFKSLSYHAVVRKGYKSGLQLEPHDNVTQPSGKLYNKLKELKEDLNLSCELDMQSLFQYLKAENYLPPFDMLTKLKQKNKWLQDYYFLFQKEQPTLKGHYFILIMREIVERWGNLEMLQNDITRAGFDIIHSETIEKEKRLDLSKSLRGGNWSAGPWPVSGGLPFHIFVVYDPQPLRLTGKMKKTHPMVSSGRILFKQKWREQVNQQQGKENSANFVHTSDNNDETLDYLEHLSPSGLKQIEENERSL